MITFQMLLGKGNPQDDPKRVESSDLTNPLLQDVGLDNADCEVTLKIRGGRVVGHRQEGSDLETAAAITSIAHNAVEDYLREQQPPPKRRCRVRPIPIKVEWPVITLKGDREVLGEYIEPELPMVKTEPREEEEDGQ